MLVTLLGITTLVRLVQPPNASEPVLPLTLSDIITDFRLEHPTKTFNPTTVPLLRMTTDAKLEQPSNALSLMLITLLGTVIDFKLEQY
jgi:hypothetical protein